MKTIHYYLLLSLTVASVRSIQGCLTEPAFSKKFVAELKGKQMETLFKSGTFLGEGSFGKVHEVQWNSGVAAAKRVRKPRSTLEIRVQEDEMALMDAMREKKSVVAFHGCLETFDFLYLIQEKLYKDLESATVVVTLKNLPLAERYRKYAHLTEIFEILHNANIFHEDIKPGNIMTTDKDLSDFRIIDMGLASRGGGAVLGGTPIFNVPEKIGYGSPKAEPTQDIYALALTFAVLESKIENIFRGAGSTCFTSSFSQYCHNTVMANVEKALQQTKMDALIPIVKKGAAFKKSDRYQTMHEMLSDIKKVIEKIDPTVKSNPLDPKEFGDLMRSKNNVDKARNSKAAANAEKKWLKKDEFVRENKILTKGLRSNYFKQGEKNSRKSLEKQLANHRNELKGGNLPPVKNPYGNVQPKVDTNRYAPNKNPLPNYHNANPKDNNNLLKPPVVNNVPENKQQIYGGNKPLVDPYNKNGAKPIVDPYNKGVVKPNVEPVKQQQQVNKPMDQFNRPAAGKPTNPQNYRFVNNIYI